MFGYSHLPFSTIFTESFNGVQESFIFYIDQSSDFNLFIEQELGLNMFIKQASDLDMFLEQELDLDMFLEQFPHITLL